LEESGVPESVIEYVRKDTEKPAGLRSETAVDVSLQDGDIIPFNNTPLRVLHTPGHSLGSICLYYKEDQILFTGDHLLKKITSNPMIEIPVEDSQADYTSLIGYLDSLEKIRQLEVHMALPAHGDLILNHRQVIANMVDHHQQRKDQITRLISREELTAYEISRRIFGELHPLEVFLGISEVLAHLEILKQEQMFCSEKKGSIVYFSLPS
jgi:glyoxylase-like metal-dependent hydrolase (beta-lactamase superfamily II)